MKRRKGQRALECAVGAVICLWAAAGHAELRTLDADLALSADGVLHVEEIGDYGTPTGTRAVVRWIGPTVHPVAVLSVVDALGRDVPYTAEPVGALTRIEIQVPGVRVQPETRFVVAYEVVGAAHRSQSSTTLEWPVTGWETHTPLRDVSATLSVPGVSSSDVDVACAVGHPLEASRACEWGFEEGRVVIEPTPVSSGHGLSVSARLPAGVISAVPGRNELFWRRATDALSPWMIPPVVLLLGLGVRAWRTRTRWLRRDVVPSWFRRRSGPELGTLYRGDADAMVLVSAVIELAEKRVLEIAEIVSPTRLFGSVRDYVLIRRREVYAPLSAYEDAVLATLFEMSDEVSVRSLAGPTRAQLVSLAEAAHDVTRANTGWVVGSPGRARLRLRVVAAAMVLAALTMLFVGQAEAAAGLFGCAALAALFAPLATVRTPAGARVMPSIRALRAALNSGAPIDGAPPLNECLSVATGLGCQDALLAQLMRDDATPPPWFTAIGAVDRDTVWRRLGGFCRALAGAAVALPHTDALLPDNLLSLPRGRS